MNHRSDYRADSLFLGKYSLYFGKNVQEVMACVCMIIDWSDAGHKCQLAFTVKSQSVNSKCIQPC